MRCGTASRDHGSCGSPPRRLPMILRRMFPKKGGAPRPLQGAYCTSPGLLVRSAPAIRSAASILSASCSHDWATSASASFRCGSVIPDANFVQRAAFWRQNSGSPGIAHRTPKACQEVSPNHGLLPGRRLKNSGQPLRAEFLPEKRPDSGDCDCPVGRKRSCGGHCRRTECRVGPGNFTPSPSQNRT